MTKPHPQIDRTARGHRRLRLLEDTPEPQHFIMFLLLPKTLSVHFSHLCHSLDSLPNPLLPQSANFSCSFSFSFMVFHSSKETGDNLHPRLQIHGGKASHSFTFLPLKDLRYADKALQGHTWFISSLYDYREEGEVQYQQFPSESSQNKLLCLKGRETHDSSWNYYALTWPEILPHNATLMKGLTFVSYNHYDYGNIWHGLSAMVPFVAWHRKSNCELSTRWILYHWGELRMGMGLWLKTLMEAIIENFDGINEDEPVCFEKAVVMRHNEGGMSRNRRMEVYGLMRCKARMYCNVSLENKDTIGMTLFMRTGPRSFRNESAVAGIFQKECTEVEGCRLTVAYSNNLTS